MNSIVKPVSVITRRLNSPPRQDLKSTKKEVIESTNKRNNQNIQSNNSVVNLQSRALQLKQQTTDVNRKPLNLESVRSTNHVEFKLPQNQPSSRVIVRDSLRENMLLQSRNSPFVNSSQNRNFSENQRQIESRVRQKNYSPSNHHVLSHKNPPNLDSSLPKRQT
jgi:hypothetical protein